MKIEYHIIKLLTFFLISIGVVPNMEAATEQYVQTASVINGTTLTVDDPLFPAIFTPNWATTANISYQDISNQVIFKFDPHNTTYQQCNYIATIDISISSEDATGATQNQNTSLTIEYNNDRGVRHKDQDYLIFNGGHRVTITVTNININFTPGTCSGIPNNLILENRIQMERYYNFDPNVIGNFLNCSPSPTYLSNSNEAELQWNAIDGAEFYDLEWLHINDYNGIGGALIPSLLEFDFRHNSTRIQTKNTSYLIPVIYDQGYIVFRYRAIGIGGTNYDIPIVGKWTISDGIKNDPTNSCHLKIGPGGIAPIHEGDSLNYQYIANFAEEGKNKLSVSYFDGSLRNRQVVSRLNTEKESIVGESIYDYNGRQAIQVLPTPTKDQKIQYYELYNRPIADNNRNYDRTDFDLDNTSQSCDAGAEEMSPTIASTGSTGSSNYYSNLNTDKSEHQAYLPQAYNYPFTQIEYTPDNTGRIRRQSGVGPTHKLGSGHETIYQYGKPFQFSLDRLFGNEVGYFSHYKKNMVEDANGQISVSYLDQQGRVVATSLAGNAPQNLHSLDSNKEGNPELVKANILDNKPRLPGENQLVSAFTYLASTAGDHTFDYSIAAERFQPECMKDFCYDCVYNLVISVKDDCGEEMIPGGAIRDTIGPFSNGVFELDSLCNDTIYVNKDFVVYLDVGNYSIHKTLTINEEALQYYWQDYMNQESCVIPLDDFIDEEIVQIDFSQCDPATTCIEICNQYFDPQSQQMKYDSCVLDCEKADPCRAGYLAMLTDFYPGGQYAQFELDGTSTDTIPKFKASECFSILNKYSAGNICGTSHYFYDEGDGITGYNDVLIEYEDENGDLIMVTLPDGTSVTPNKLSVTDFITYFDPIWAKSLIKYHPEYCDYSWCNLRMRSSDDYDLLMESTETYADALNLGLLNPLGENSAPVNTSELDPFFQVGGAGIGTYVNMSDFMNNQSVTYPGNALTFTFNLWEYSAIAVICNAPDAGDSFTCAQTVSNTTIFDPFSSDNPCAPDRIWKIFRGLYLGEKQRLSDSLKICLNPPSEKAERFPTFEDGMSAEGYDEVYGDPYDISNDLVGIATDSIEAVCDSQCQAYADNWMFRLQGCNPSNSNWSAGNLMYDQLREKLIEICVMGCDEAHPFGATSVHPDSTGVTPINGATNYFNFEDAIVNIFGSASFDCNANLINMPGSYDFEYISMTEGGNMDTCACDNILEAERIYQIYINGPGLPPGISNLSDIFLRMHGEDVDEIERKACLCNDAFSKGQNPSGQPWSKDGVWTSEAVDFLDTIGEYVPISLTCTDCVTCERIQNEMDSYSAYMVSQYNNNIPIPDSMMGQAQIMTTTHLNEHFGLDLTFIDYEEFLDECDSSLASGLYCGDITIEARDLEKLLLNLALQIDDGTADLLDTACLCDNPYGDPPTDPNLPYTPESFSEYFNFWSVPPYTNSLIDNIDPNYNFSDSICDHLYTFDQIVGNTLTGNIFSQSGNDIPCQLELTFIDTGYDFDNIITFFNIRSNPDSLINGTNTHFLIDVRVSYDGNDVITTLRGNTDCFPIVDCSDNEKILTLCNPTDPYPPENNPCVDHLINNAINNAVIAYGLYLEQTKDEFREAYINKCFEASTMEKFEMEFYDNEYHYTLYYYDQAGNLVQTVPPEGVEFLTDATCVGQAAIDRSTTGIDRELFTKHRMATKYRYNSLNQLVEQHVPDHDDFDDWRINSIGIPSGLNIHDIDFATDLKGYFVATQIGSSPLKGIMYQTVNGGQNWQPMAVNSINPGDMMAVQFINANIGYAVGENGILIKTVDGGNTWCLIYTGAVEYLVGIHVSTSATNEILVFDVSGNIFHSTNSGDTWHNGSPGNAAASINLSELNEVLFINNLEGFAVGEESGHGNIYKTIDGGDNWFPLTDYRAKNLRTTQIVNQTTAYVAGDNGTLLKSIDEGSNWNEMDLNILDHIKNIYFENTGNGLLLTAAGQLLTSINGGNTWNTDGISSNVSNLVYNTTTNTIYIVDFDGRIHYKSIVNSSWTTINKPPTGIYQGFQTISPKPLTDEIVIGGNLGRVYKYNLNTQSWASISSPFINFNKLYLDGNTAITLTSQGLKYCDNTSGSTWSWNDPTDNTGNEVDFHFYNSLGYALNSNGDVQLSTDNGKSWSPLANDPLSLGGTSPQSGIHYFNAGSTIHHIIAVGQEGDIHYTADNGTTDWSGLSNNYNPPELNGIDAINANEIFAVGNDGTFIKSNDAGTTWDSETTLTILDLNAVDFETANKGAIGGESGVYHETSNGGASWTLGLNYTSTINDIEIQNSFIVIAAEGGNLAQKNGYGGSWNSQNVTSYNFNRLTTLPTGNMIFAVGDEGQIWYKNQSNISWLQSQAFITEPLLALDFSDSNNGHAAGTDGMVLTTSNGGDLWLPQASATTNTLNDVAFANNNTGVIAGDNLTLHETGSGGITWSNTNISGSTTQVDLNGVDISEDGSFAIVVGDGGKMLNTTDFINWSSVTPPTGVGNNNLNAVELKDNVGYIVGDDGMILKSQDCLIPFASWSIQQADNNEDWATFTSGQNSDLHDVQFVDRETGYVVGKNGLILKTITGGNYWTSRISNTTTSINTIHLQNETQGFIGGDDSYLVRMDDNTDQFSTRFWYDALGRLVASQNSKQFAMSPPHYSYTAYDELGRIVEVGELASNIEANETLINHNNYPENWEANRTEVTKTIYDNSYLSIIAAQFGSDGQEHLRNRVASVFYYDEYSLLNQLNYRFASHYSYDIHGNVKTLINENKDLDHFQQQYKKVDYKYDLVSGNVNEVHYQPGECDQFYHRYHYDADNRIDSVWTSSDGIQWDTDARYKYYQHGPLARVELGDLLVQGMDYAYTIQGWIKGVNSNSLDADKDIGKDGLSSTPNQLVARDAYGFSLNYYDNEYNSIDPTAQNFLASVTGTPLDNASENLYNGNISKMVTSLTDLTGAKLDVQGMAYQYDQLNRLVDAAAFASPNVALNNSFAGVTDNGEYHTEYTYDANGNIESLLRNGASPIQQMDSMRYRYTEHGSEKINNRLNHVNDPIASGNYPNTNAPDTEDIDDQGNYDPSHPFDWNYDYDEIGNLTQDLAEEIDRIEWTVYGKVKKVIRTTNNHDKADLEFAYDPSGNRIMKLVKPRTAGVLQPQEKWKYTYYVRDASGNIMATYNRSLGASGVAPAIVVSDSLKINDHHLYGSSRLGVEDQDLLLTDISFNSTGADADGQYLVGSIISSGSNCVPVSVNRVLGKKQFELSNHLGNVLAVISDRKIAKEQGGSFSHFDSNVDQYSDYYAFGMLMPGRKIGKYNYGFQGEEIEDDISGQGNNVFFKFRIHNPRLGRFFSIDPLHDDFPWNSTYSFSENRLLDGIELEGLEYYRLNPSYGLTNIAHGFADYFGGVIQTLEGWAGSKELVLTNYDSDKIETTIKVPGFLLYKSSVTVDKETNTSLVTYFYTRGEQGVSWNTSVKKEESISVLFDTDKNISGTHVEFKTKDGKTYSGIIEQKIDPKTKFNIEIEGDEIGELTFKVSGQAVIDGIPATGNAQVNTKGDFEVNGGIGTLKNNVSLGVNKEGKDFSAKSSLSFKLKLLKETLSDGTEVEVNYSKKASVGIKLIYD